MDFIDLGEKIGETKTVNFYYPSFSIDAVDLGKYDVGDTLEATVKLKIVSADITLGEKTRYRVEVRKIAKREIEIGEKQDVDTLNPKQKMPI